MNRVIDVEYLNNADVQNDIANQVQLLVDRDLPLFNLTSLRSWVYEYSDTNEGQIKSAWLIVVICRKQNIRDDEVSVDMIKEFAKSRDVKALTTTADGVKLFDMQLEYMEPIASIEC